MFCEIYIPVPGSTAEKIIDKGSGVVGKPHSALEVTVYYEGNRFGSANLGKYEERVAMAVSWKVSFSPTRAKARLLESELILVGHFDARGVQIYNYKMLESWLEQDELSRLKQSAEH